VPYTSVYHENRFSTVRRVGTTSMD
jgi:hypothetical protein